MMILLRRRKKKMMLSGQSSSGLRWKTDAYASHILKGEYGGGRRAW
jgi:hypothetical protein